jgi:hypothetical protein
MSASGQKLPRQHYFLVSALPPKADTSAARRRVCFGPKADITPAVHSEMKEAAN